MYCFGYNESYDDVAKMGEYKTRLLAMIKKFREVQPNGKDLAADGVFFNQGGPFNQGNIYTFDTDEFTAAMETAEAKVGTVNEQGIKLQKEFTYEKTLNKILEVIQSDTGSVTPTETS